MTRTLRHLLRTRTLLLAGCLASVAVPAAFAQPDGTIHEYLTREEALEEVFPRATQYLTETVQLGPEVVARAEQALHRELDEQAFDVVLTYDASGAFVGYAVITEEVGKYRPITFIVGITPKLEVEKVAIMVYREDRGGEVRTPRFLYQYTGKTARDPVRTNRDIINISGATLSVRALNAGVKKVLYLVTEHYRDDPPAPTYQEERAHSSKQSNG